MKTLRILICAIILIICSQICFSQEKPKAILYDVIEGMENSCDQFLGRLDGFISKLTDNPLSIGYIIINGKKVDKAIFRYERRIYSSLELRKFDKSRIVIVRAEDTERSKVEFWLVPQGAEYPQAKEFNVDLTISENTKPFAFNSNVYDTEASCPSGKQLKIYSDYLNANPNVFGNIVIFDTSRKIFDKERSKIFKELTEEYKVSPKKLRFFFAKPQPNPFNNSSYIEFWFVPIKKRK